MCVVISRFSHVFKLFLTKHPSSQKTFMKKLSLLLSVFVLNSGLQHASAQSIGPSIINATGGSGAIGSYMYDWSIGELCMVSTYYGSDIIVTQGLLQNDISFAAGVANHTLTDGLQVFPNPASSEVNLRLTSATEGRLSYRLMDMTGKTIKTSMTDIRPGATLEQLNISGLAAATYLLEVSFKTEGTEAEMTSFKIQKLK